MQSNNKPPCFERLLSKAVRVEILLTMLSSEHSKLSVPSYARSRGLPLSAIAYHCSVLVEGGLLRPADGDSPTRRTYELTPEHYGSLMQALCGGPGFRASGEGGMG